MLYRIRYRSSEDEPAITLPHFLVTQEEDMTGEVFSGGKVETFEEARDLLTELRGAE